MKKIFAVLLSLGLLLTLSVTAYAADPALVKQAQELKSKGDYEGAAKVHPKKLCVAMYYWNAACKVVGHRNEHNDWVRNAKVTNSEKVTGLALLDEAEKALEDSVTQDGTENAGCKGVDKDSLRRLIKAVRDCINGNCE